MKKFIPSKGYEIIHGIRYAVFWAEQEAVKEGRNKGYKRHRKIEHSSNDVLRHRIAEKGRRTGQSYIYLYVYSQRNRKGA